MWLLALTVVNLYAQSLTGTNALDSLKAAAQAGDPLAQLQLGSAYEMADGVSKDYVQAYKWYYLAAAQPDDTNVITLPDGSKGPPPPSQSSVARLSLNILKSKMKPEQIQEAERLLNKEAPNAKAKVDIDLVSDDRKEFEHDKELALKGDAFFQAALAFDYERGKGVAKDPEEAVKWYRRAAEQGNASAQDSLGTRYEQGNGVSQDAEEAAKWYLRAAMQGDRSAMWSLGKCFEQGNGAPQDYVQAYKWFNIAAMDPTLGPIIKSDRDSLAEKMLPEQIAEAQRLSSAFIPRKETPSLGPNSGLPATASLPTASGTGFLITDDGYLISNYHVVKDAAKVRLLTSAGTMDAKVVRVDAANDLALLKADGKFSPLPVAPSRSVNLGTTVATVGFPNIGLQGFSPKLAKGEIASLSGAADDARYFQISVPVQPGNSGGALVDERGNVVGIVSAKLDAATALASSGALPENVNYAVKSSFLLSFLESVPEVSAKLKPPNTKDEKFEDVVKSAQAAAVLVLVY